MDDVTDAVGKSLFNIAEDTLPDLAEMGVDQFFGGWYFERDSNRQNFACCCQSWI